MLNKEAGIFITVVIILSVIFVNEKNIKMVVPYLQSPIVNVLVIAVILFIGFIHIGYGILFGITYLFVYYKDMEIRKESIINEGFTPTKSPSSNSKKHTSTDDELLKKKSDSVISDTENIFGDNKPTQAAQPTSVSGESVQFQTLNLKILTNESNINSNTKNVKDLDDRVKKLEDDVKANTLNVKKLQNITGNPNEEDMKKLDNKSKSVENVNLTPEIPK